MFEVTFNSYTGLTDGKLIADGGMFVVTIFTASGCFFVNAANVFPV